MTLAKYWEKQLLTIQQVPLLTWGFDINEPIAGSIKLLKIFKCNNKNLQLSQMTQQVSWHAWEGFLLHTKNSPCGSTLFSLH